MAFYGRPSLPFASPATLQTSKTPLQWLLMGFQYRQKLPQGQIHCCFWAVQRSVRQALASQGHFNGFLWTSSAGKSYPKARSIAFSGRSSVPLARHSQRTGIPRPHPWLFMGVQACRLPARKRSKRLSSAGKSYPEARSIAVSRRSSVPFARHSQPTGIPRPHQWLLMGLQRRQKLPQGQIHCFFSAVQRAIGQAFATNRHQASGVQACRLLLFSFTTPSLTENLFPHTVRWSICPVFTSLATFPLQAGQT